MIRAISVLLLIIVISLSSKAQGGYEIDQMHVDILLQKDGFVKISETIDVNFIEERRGIIRKIPFRYRNDKNEAIDLKLSNISVSGYEFSVSEEGNDVSIRIGNVNKYITGNHRYIITYKIKKPYIYHEDYTEFYFNIVGAKWDTGIAKATFFIKLESKTLLEKNMYSAFIGKQGSQEDSVKVVYSDYAISGTALRPLDAYEGVTISLKLPIGALARPSKLEIIWEKFGDLIISIPLFLGFLGFFIAVFLKYGRDYPVIKAARFTPPNGVSPSEAGVIIDEKADTIDVMVLIPDWAQRGHLTITQIPKKWQKDDHKLDKIKDLPADVPIFEKTMFNGLFSGGNTRLISDLKDTFYTTISSSKKQLEQHIKKQDIYYPISMTYQVITGTLSVFVFLAGVGLSIFFSSAYPVVLMSIVAIAGMIITYFMLKKNEKGVHLYQEVLGFKLFIQQADKDRLELMLKDDPMYFEKTLPYAIVFGFAKVWSKKFEGLDMEPPRWYISPLGYAHFSPYDFGRTLDSGMNDMQSVMTSVPQSTGGGSSGGFGGGGFSGGGFGGGGGSSW